MWIRLGFIYHVWKTVCPLVRVCNESNCLIESNQIKSNRIESNWIESNRIESKSIANEMKRESRVGMHGRWLTQDGDRSLQNKHTSVRAFVFHLGRIFVRVFSYSSTYTKICMHAVQSRFNPNGSTIPDWCGSFSFYVYWWVRFCGRTAL